MRNNTANTVVLIVNLLLGRNSGLQIIMEDKMHGGGGGDKSNTRSGDTEKSDDADDEINNGADNNKRKRPSSDASSSAQREEEEKEEGKAEEEDGAQDRVEIIQVETKTYDGAASNPGESTAVSTEHDTSSSLDADMLFSMTELSNNRRQ